MQDKKKTIIAPKSEQKFFKIGHSSASSETFIPEFYIDLEYKKIMVDIAGLSDTSGLMIELVNSLMNKFIF